MERGKSPPKIKICGLTRECDMDYLNEAGPEYIGFVFASGRRQIAPQDAEFLRSRLAEEIQAVGVFVDEEPERVAALIQAGVIDIVQLHGHEDAAYVKYLKEQVKCRIIKAMHPGKEEVAEIEAAEIYRQYEAAGVDYFLFDSGSKTQAGGTGETFDWSLIPQVSLPWFLAGGLSVENVETAIRDVRPYALDISSGVESEGYKDREKILEIIRRIRNV